MGIDHHPATHRVRRRELADDQVIPGQRNERCLEPELRVAGVAQRDDSGRRLTRAVMDVHTCASLERPRARLERERRVDQIGGRQVRIQRGHHIAAA